MAPLDFSIKPGFPPAGAERLQLHPTGKLKPNLFRPDAELRGIERDCKVGNPLGWRVKGGGSGPGPQILSLLIIPDP